jgi:uncharacterized membrane protein YgdD (TMEM256/DUF423 family)
MPAGRRWIVIGSLLAGLAVATGAFAAHGIYDVFERQYRNAEPRQVNGEMLPLAQKYLRDFKTAAEYQMYHGLAILAVGLLALQRPCRTLDAAAVCFLLGTILFSGSLYLLTLTNVRILGAIVPMGGVLFLVGWGLLAGAAWKGDDASGSVP